MEQVYDIFISYSRKDYLDENQNIIPDNVVSTIKDTLTKEGISFWFDEECIYSGQNFIEKIVNNIESSKLFLYLSTANANNSRWTCKEIASANEFGKPIIPVRIDRSPYNKKVMFLISDLDYIEYYNNPETGLRDMVLSIKAHLQSLKEEEERKKKEEEALHEAEIKRLEEERRKKEEEERRRQEEQKRIVADIELACTRLNNEEKKIELDRGILLVDIERVIDTERKEQLRSFIISSSPIRQKLVTETKQLQERVHELEKALEALTRDREQLELELEETRVVEDHRETIQKLKKELAEKKAAFERSEKECQLLGGKLDRLQHQLEEQTLTNTTNGATHLKIWPWIVNGVMMLVATFVYFTFSNSYNKNSIFNEVSLFNWFFVIGVSFSITILLLTFNTLLAFVGFKRNSETHFKDVFQNRLHNQWNHYVLFILFMVVLASSWGNLCNLLLYGGKAHCYVYNWNNILIDPILDEPLFRLLPFLVASIPLVFIGQKRWMKVLKSILFIAFAVAIEYIQIIYWTYGKIDISWPNNIYPIQGQGEIYAIVYGLVFYVAFKTINKEDEGRKAKAFIYAHSLAFVASILVHALTTLSLMTIEMR